MNEREETFVFLEANERGLFMPDTFHNETSSEIQGSILRGILGSVTGMIVCILVMLLCSLFQIDRKSVV